MSDKLNDLQKKIDEIKQKIEKKEEVADDDKSDTNKLSLVLNCLLELTSGFIIGGAIGYSLDKLLGTKLICLAIFTFLGFFAGLLNLYRYLKRLL